MYNLKEIILKNEESSFFDKDIFKSDLVWFDYVVKTDPNNQVSTFWINKKEAKNKKFYTLGKCNELLITSFKENGKKTIEFLDSEFRSIYKTEFKVGTLTFSYKPFFIFDEYLKGDKIHIFNLNNNISFKSISILDNKWLSTDTDDKKYYDGRIFQIIGVWNNQLLLHLGRYRLIALNVDTGEELWRIENFLKEIEDDKTIHFKLGIKTVTDWILDETEDVAYLFARKYLIKLDLKQKKASLIKDYFKDTGFNWSFKYVQIQDNLITFSAGEEFKFPSYFGVIDKESKEILWSTKCNSGSYLVEAPKINGNKLYVSDSENTLYVYEKEELI